MPTRSEFCYGFVQVSRQFGGNVRALESQRDVGLDEVELVADIMAFPGKAESVHPMILQKGNHGVRKLDFVVFPSWSLGKVVENLRLEHVTRCNREVGRGFLGGRFLNELFESKDPSPFLMPRFNKQNGQLDVGSICVKSCFSS